MTNPIMWAVSRIKDMIWRYQFKRTPIQRIGPLLVKDFRGSLYCVGTIDDMRPTHGVDTPYVDDEVTQ